ncbi:MAG: hypothetical protein LBM64_01030 [Deltaproteobacteria bacterium]|jgi:hypothetical protein|nr:hypothetical protein [Deltaproteobacteria bacterium]
MSINFFGMNALGGKNYGEVWKPKTRRLMVGRDVAPITATEMEGKADRAVTLGKGDDVAFMSGKIFNFAKNLTQSGMSVRGFRSYETAGALNGMDKGAMSGLSGAVLHDSDKYRIVLDRSDGGFRLAAYEKFTDEAGQEQLRKLAKADFTDDAKISWENGAPKILSGAAARNGDTLAASGKDEILIRTSASKVKAGENTTVYNFSDSGGEFSGGNNVTYLGAYTQSVFKEGAGKSVYAGYFQKSKFSGNDNSLGRFSGVFENSEIEAGANDDIFSGYFSASKINGGNGENAFSGLFINQSAVSGGDDNDAFNGRFIASDLFGGKGDDAFGKHIDLNNLSYILPENDSAYYGLAPDFIKANLEAGEGDDKFEGVAWESRIHMGDGHDRAMGLFTASTLDGGEGDNNLSAMYSMASLFKAGGGNDVISLASSVASLINPGEGEDQVSLGRNQGKAGDGGLGGDHLMPVTRWLTPEEARHDERGLAFGELRANLVDASRGKNRVTIHNGEGTNKVETGDIFAAQESGKAEEASAGEKAGASEKRKAIGRYAVQSGDAPLREGGLAAVVKTGAGGNLSFRGLDRGPGYERLIDETPVSNLLRKASAAYSWTVRLG